MKFILDLIKGAFIGVANIIPGVSGGTMAVSMGVYDKLINAINGLTKKFKESFITLLPLIIGMVAGIGAFSFIIPYCLEHYSFQTAMCFSGLIIGGIPSIIASTGSALQKEKKRINPVHIIAFLILLSVAVFMAVANPSSTGSDEIIITPVMLIKLIVMGIIAAATMVIPGVSGSLILMILGYYSGIVGSISGLLSSLKNFDASAIGHYVIILVPFGVGCILGILLISKLITFLLKKFESITYCAILGLIAASPFAILYKMENPVFNAVSIIAGVVLLVVCTLFTYSFGKKTK